MRIASISQMTVIDENMNLIFFSRTLFSSSNYDVVGFRVTSSEILSQVIEMYFWFGGGGDSELNIDDRKKRTRMNEITVYFWNFKIG